MNNYVQVHSAYGVRWIHGNGLLESSKGWHSDTFPRKNTVSVAPFEEDFIKDTWNCCDRGFKRSDQDETIDVILH